MISRLSTKTLKFIPMGLKRGLLFKAEFEKNHYWFTSYYKLQRKCWGSLNLQYDKCLDIDNSDNKETKKRLPPEVNYNVSCH